ncbi:unnamed protein product [Oikopleura dioica]|uniref:Uncharacterized protein n=1 Tax=Oikopleura dioica TaxID=34765 RepID=E4X8M7_OIKDI|nr:unnamed protein product [Oikopleura dioica]
MKIAQIIITAAVDARLMINMNERNPPSKGTFSTPEPENDRLLMINKLDENTCCSKLIANDLFHGQRAFEKASDDETWLDENGDVIFYNQQFQIWQLIPNSVGKDVNSFGTAFSSGSFVNGRNCPDTRSWTISNNNRWTTVKNFLSCQSSIRSEDDLAFDLSERVCQLLKTAVSNLKQYKMDSLCQRAKFISDRVVRQRSCAISNLGRSNWNLVASLDTLREWRDQLLSINRKRNENCDNNSELEVVIERFHASMMRKILKNTRK